MSTDRFLDKVKKITKDDLKRNKSINLLLTHTIEELGEFANALTVEQGHKKKELKESSKQEAIDVVICGLSLFFASGGTKKELADYGMKKLKKWEKRLEN